MATTPGAGAQLPAPSPVPVENLPLDGSAGHTTAGRAAFSYLRVSSVRQAAEARTGLDRQADQFMPFCQRHGLLPADDQLIDRGISAYRGSNRRKGSLGAFLDAARNGVIPSGSVLVVEDLDRFSREAPSYSEAMLGQLFELDLALGICRDDVVVDRARYDSDSPLRFMLVVRRDAAHDYSKKLSERVSAAHERVRARERQGERLNAHWRPQWLDYDADADTFTMNDRWPTYRRMLDLCLEGHGQVRTAAILNGEGYRNAKGGLWSGAAVAQAWADRRLLGERIYRQRGAEPEVLAGYFPSAITSAEFSRVQELIAQRRSNVGRAGRGEFRHNLFQSIVFCHCGQRLELQSQRKKSGRVHRYLVCKSKIRGRGAGHCTACNIPYDEDWLLQAFMSERWAEFFDRPADNKKRRDLDRQVREAEGLLAQKQQQHVQAEVNFAQLATKGVLDADTAALLGKVVKDARQAAAGTEATLTGLREQLRQATIRPSGKAMQAMIRQRVEAFMATDRHDPAHRIRFNNWLCSLNVRLYLSRSKLSFGNTTQMSVEPLQKVSYDGKGGATVKGAEFHVKLPRGMKLPS
jgi:DNA invertase Pin-like site-specific DNA recombinase